MTLALPLLRAGFVAGLLLSSGLSLFALLVLPRAVAGQAVAVDLVWRPVRRGAVAALVLGGFCWVGWVLAQSAAIAGAGSVTALATVLPVVLGETRFGRLALAQGVLLAGCGLVIGGRAPRSGLVRIALPAMLALLLQAGHGHGWAMRDRDWPLLLSGPLHLACAGFWLGGLAGLLLLLRAAPVRLVASAARRFGPPGRLCVAGMALSAWVQGMVLVGGLRGLFGTAYGRVALLKLGLFCALTGFALLNRHRLAPALLGAAPERARRRLALSIGVQGAVGLLAVLAASLLSGLPPAMHAMDRAGMGM